MSNAVTTLPCIPPTLRVLEPPARGLLGFAERGLLPGALIRFGVRRLCEQRLREEATGGPEAEELRLQQRLKVLRSETLAVHPEAANAQHYELPAEFFAQCLGPRLKYSCAYYPRGNESLPQAEETMLELYGERGELADGQDILELGCGWGSLTLWMAARYPHARILAVSNSASQRAFVEARCHERGITNVRVITRDVNHLALPAAQFDRCISIEMFEHMRNYEILLARIAGWLKPSGKLFVHVFAHRTRLYLLETDGADNWLGRHFFTGGLMPSIDTLLWFSRDLACERRWLLDGTHYAHTANDWLDRHDANRAHVSRILRAVYGSSGAALAEQRWRMFWMACAETFGYQRGREWLVAHYRFARA